MKSTPKLQNPCINTRNFPAPKPRTHQNYSNPLGRNGNRDKFDINTICFQKWQHHCWICCSAEFRISRVCRQIVCRTHRGEGWTWVSLPPMSYYSFCFCFHLCYLLNCSSLESDLVLFQPILLPLFDRIWCKILLINMGLVQAHRWYSLQVLSML